MELSENRFPEIGTPIYETILPTATPQGGPILAFYSLARTYYLLKKYHKARDCVNEVLKISPSNNRDINALPVILSDFMTILSDPQNDRASIKSCIQLAMKYKPLGGTGPLPFLVICIFGIADAQFQNQNSKKMLTLLIVLFEELFQVPQADHTFWKAEVQLRRAKLLKSENGNKIKLKKVYSEVLSYARASNNSSVLIESSHALGFELWDSLSSLQELAEFQFAQIKGVEAENRDFDRLSILGRNLFELWKKVVWKRLLATDLPTKKLLMDSAKEMKEAGTSVSLAEPVMVLLLAKLFGHSGPSVEWAKAACSVGTLPENILGLLDEGVV